MAFQIENENEEDEEELTGIGWAIAKTLQDKLKDRREHMQSSDEEEEEWDDQSCE